MTASTLRAETDKQIFVSYSRADRDHVAALYADLERLGFLLWRDLHEIAGGEDWWQNITDAIDASETMVLCISPASLKSEIVTKEWLYARQVGTRVIPVIVDDIDFDTLPRWMQFTDMKDFREGKPERELIWRRFIHDLNTPYTPNKVSFMVEAPPFDYVERKDVTDKIITSLQDPANRLIALKGAGGYGKTTLARVVCHDQRVRTTYFHGTLWITLGETVSEEMRIQLLLDLVVELRGERPPVQTLEAARNELRTAIGDRYVLLVVDDAWRRPDLESFLVDAPNAAVLVTTRIRPALPDKTLIHDIDAMQPDQAVRLLAFELPEDEVARQHTKLDSLAKRLGEWPLMIKLTNGAIKSRMSMGSSFKDALDFVEKSLTRRGLSQSFADTEKGRNATAAASLAVSLDLLQPDERALYNRLAIFPEDIEIPLETLESLWELDDFDTEDFAQRLFNVSLLLRLDLKAKIIRLHDIVRTHLRETDAAHLPALNADFLARMQQRYSITHWRDLPLDAPYLWNHLAYHLIDAGQTAALRDLLFDFGWMYARLNATDPAALLADAALATSALKDDRELRLIESALRLAQNALSEDKKQLANQIRGRLWIYKDKPDKYPAIVSLWHAVPDIPGTLALLPTQEFPPMDQAGGALLRVLDGHKTSVNGALQLSDNRILSWAGSRFESQDNTLRLWTSDGTALDTLEGHTDEVRGALELPDGRILSWAGDATLRLWDSDGTLLKTLEGHTDSVHGALLLSNDHILSWSSDQTLRLWTIDGTLLSELKGHNARVVSALELQDGKILSYANGYTAQTNDNTLHLWNVDGKLHTVLTGHRARINGAIQLQEGYILSWSGDDESFDNTLRLWTTEGDQVAVFEGHEKEVWGATQLANANILSWSRDNTLRIWKTNGQSLAVLRNHTREVMGAIQLHNEHILSWSYDGTYHLWDRDGNFITSIDKNMGVTRFVVKLSSEKYVSSTENDLIIWDEDFNKLLLIEAHTEQVRGALQLKDGRLLSWSSDRTLRLWDTALNTLNVKRGHTRKVIALHKLPDNKTLTVSTDYTFSIWNSTGHHLVKLDGFAFYHGNASPMPQALVFSDNDNYCRILTWPYEQNLRLWDADGNMLAELLGHKSAPWGARYLNSGRILTWSWDSTLRMWDQYGQPLNVLEGHSGWVHEAVELNDGRIVSWAEDGVRLWKTDGGLIDVFEVSSSDDHYEDQVKTLLLEWGDKHQFNAIKLIEASETADESYQSTTKPTKSDKKFLGYISDAIHITHIDNLVFSPTLLPYITNDHTVVVGDEAGRVIFLKVIPPTD